MGKCQANKKTSAMVIQGDCDGDGVGTHGPSAADAGRFASVVL